MIPDRRHRPTHLFTVRLWIEPGAQAGAEVRGRVQHVLSGEVIYVRTWTALTAFFETALAVERPPPDREDQGAHDNR